VLKYVCKEIKVCKVFDFQWCNPNKVVKRDENGGRKGVTGHRMWHLGFLKLRIWNENGEWFVEERFKGWFFGERVVER